MFRTLVIAMTAGAALLSTQAANAERNYWSASDRNDRYGSQYESESDWGRDDGYRNASYDERGYDSDYDQSYSQGQSVSDYARVVDVKPNYRTVRVQTPQRECWDEVVYEDRSRRRNGNAPAAIAGGIIGGVVGHQFGSGRGNDAMTVLGTLVGSAIARDVAADRSRREHHGYQEARTVQRCETRTQVSTEQRIDGYTVTYEYDGRHYVTQTREHPGNQVAVQVTVTPYEG